jgi:hypothetical protein
MNALHGRSCGGFDAGKRICKNAIHITKVDFNFHRRQEQYSSQGYSLPMLSAWVKTIPWKLLNQYQR